MRARELLIGVVLALCGYLLAGCGDGADPGPDAVVVGAGGSAGSPGGTGGAAGSAGSTGAVTCSIPTPTGDVQVGKWTGRSLVAAEMAPTSNFFPYAEVSNTLEVCSGTRISDSFTTLVPSCSDPEHDFAMGGVSFCFNLVSAGGGPCSPTAGGDACSASSMAVMQAADPRRRAICSPEGRFVGWQCFLDTERS